MATTNIYALADYTLTIKPTGISKVQTLTIGGVDSMVGQIRVSRTADTWNTQGDETGGFVHNKNYNRVGRITIQIRQVHAAISWLHNLANIYYGSNKEDKPFTITITKSGDSKAIVTGTSAFLVKPSDQTFAGTAGQQEWTFTCGKIEFTGQAKSIYNV